MPIGDVKKALTALGLPPSPSELGEFVSILDPDSEGFAPFTPFLAIAALKMRQKVDDGSAREEEVEQGYRLFANGTDGPITLASLRRVAKVLKEDVEDDVLRDMILEANGGAGVGQGVGLEDFTEVMKRAGVWR